MTGTILSSALLTTVLLTSALCPTAAQAGSRGNCPLTVLASVDLAVEPEAVYVPVTFNSKRGWLALMTDSSSSTVRESALKDLKFPVEQATTQEGFYLDIGDKRVTQVATIDRALLGPLSLPLKEWIVHPETADSKEVHGRPLIGNLAMDILWRFDFELDLAHSKLTLYSQAHCPGKVVYWADRFGRMPVEVAEFGNLYFPVEIQGKKIEASFATSSGFNVMSTTAARRLFKIDESSPNVETDTDAAGNSTRFFRVPRVALGDLAIRDMRIDLYPISDNCKLSSRGRPSGAIGYANCYGVYPLIIGRMELEKLRLYFATREHVVYFTSADPNSDGILTASN